MHISYQTYWKNYVKDREPGPDFPWPVGVAWLELARFIEQYVLSRRVSSILEVATVNPTLQARLLELSERLPDEDLVGNLFPGGPLRALPGKSLGQAIIPFGGRLFLDPFACLTIFLFSSIIARVSRSWGGFY